MSDAEEVVFPCDESPSRVSGVVLRARPREVELPLEAVVYRAVTNDELEWFPLGAESAAVVDAIDGLSTLRAAFARAGLSEAEAVPHANMLFEMGIIAFK